MRPAKPIFALVLFAAACGDKSSLDSSHTPGTATDAATDGDSPGSRTPGTPGESTGGTGGTVGTAGSGGSAGAAGGTGGAAGGTGGTGGFTCGPTCDLYCPNGNQVDEHGCMLCKCKPGPNCPALGCDPMCSYGVLKDDQGCDTCQCAPPPGTGCGPQDCTGPMPGTPNYLCPDGKTTAGPACLRNASNTCSWTIVTCPPKCVQNVLCIRGLHWDSSTCMCVADPPDGGVNVGCACPGGGVCIKQIGGPAVMVDPAITCDKPVDRCDGGTVCDCLPPKNGKCHPDPMVENECICDNGIR